MNVGYLIFSSSAFSKPSLYIQNLLVHILLKPSLKDFEHNLASMWNECSCMIAGKFFGIALLWDWNENRPFPGLCPLMSFPNLPTYWMQHFTASSFRILNSSAGIPSTPLALLVAMLSKAILTSHSRMSGSRWVTTLLWLSGSLRIFFVQFCVFLPPLLNIFCFCYALTVFVPYCAHPCMKCPPWYLQFPWWDLFSIWLFSSISLHCLFRKVFLTLLAIFKNSAFS